MMVALTTLTAFTSCDDDIDQAMALSGEWTGDFGMYYEIEDPYTGRWISFDASQTDLVFYPEYEYATYGTGKQIGYWDDYYYSKGRDGKQSVEPDTSNLNIRRGNRFIEKQAETAE